MQGTRNSMSALVRDVAQDNQQVQSLIWSRACCQAWAESPRHLLNRVFRLNKEAAFSGSLGEAFVAIMLVFD